jgi:hypothetical protein
VPWLDLRPVHRHRTDWAFHFELLLRASSFISLTVICDPRPLSCSRFILRSLFVGSVCTVGWASLFSTLLQDLAGLVAGWRRFHRGSTPFDFYSPGPDFLLFIFVFLGKVFPVSILRPWFGCQVSVTTRRSWFAPLSLGPRADRLRLLHPTVSLWFFAATEFAALVFQFVSHFFCREETRSN